jgi:hypothetical protein
MLKTINQVLLAALIAVCIGFVVSLTPTPHQKYPIESCDTPDKPYDKDERHGAVFVMTRRVVCFVDRNKDDINAWATLTIAAFTAILSIFTVRLARSTKIAADAARQASETARQEFNATHRPKIIVHVAEFKHLRSETEDGVYYAGASLLCFNIGESVAKNVEVRGKIIGGKISLDVMRELLKEPFDMESGQKARITVTSLWPAGDVAAGPRVGTEYLCVGWIAYWDENGLRRETGFCLKPQFSFAEGLDLWISAGKPEYEYAY